MGQATAPLSHQSARLAAVAITLVASACASAPAPGEPPPTARPPVTEPALPPIPVHAGPLQLDLVHPPEGAVVAADSTFVFGSTGRGGATLTINGMPVRVEPNGAFLAFLPVPRDGVYRIEARAGTETVRLEQTVDVPVPPTPSDEPIMTDSIKPAGAFALQLGETVDVSFPGKAGEFPWLVLPTGERLPMIETGAVSAADDAAANFQRTPTATRTEPGLAEYRRAVVMTGPWIAGLAADLRPALGILPDSGGGPATIELVSGMDTIRAIVPATIAVIDAALPRVGIVTAPAGAATDWTVRGRHDIAGPFHYFWPAGTRLAITGQRAGMLRVRLSADRVAWVPSGDVQLLPQGMPLPTSAVGGVRLTPTPRWIDVRIPLSERLPYHVEEEPSALHIDVFGATSRINFLQYGALDLLVESAEWSQPFADVFRVTVQLTRPLWGYRTFYDGTGALVLRIRRPPAVDPGRPLAGLLIAVDAGHPPGGAMGPTRFTEPEANLAIAQRLVPMLEAAGARVLMIRSDARPVDLGVRPRIAEDSSAHILVSIHNNAFPEGVNPFENAGTSVYYNRLQSVALARLVQRELLDELGLRDLGIGRADLALVRPTWMPSVLSETMFLMVPIQEAALRDPSVQRRIAEAHLRALEAFVRINAGG